MESKYFIEVNGELIIKQDIVDELKSLKESKDNLDKQYKELTDGITNECKERFTETTSVSGYNFIIKGGFGTVKFDEKRFKEENPELYLDYLMPKLSKITYQFSASRKGKK